ncbi:MAG: hypothetical protein IT548_08220 [Alphaproteobacteria bacterium]|nr:hypothetical protein [Alphaproteobacteria bacterium]
MTIPDLRTDCSKCEALCCVALSFEAGTSFAFDKPAGVPCPLLTVTNLCRVHDDLAERGMTGCARYDCLGAGPYVVQHLFAGRSWRRDPGIASEVMAAFSRMKQIHELIALLMTAAERLPLTPADESERGALLARLAPWDDWTPETLARFALDEVQRDVRVFLRRLGPMARASGLAPPA